MFIISSNIFAFTADTILHSHLFEHIPYYISNKLSGNTIIQKLPIMLPLTNTSNIVIDLFIIIISIISSLNSGYEISINDITLTVNLLFTLN